MLVYTRALTAPSNDSKDIPGLHERIQNLKRYQLYKNRIDFRSIVDMLEAVPGLHELLESIQVAREISRLSKERLKQVELKPEEVLFLQRREEQLLVSLTSLREENARRSVLCGSHKSPVGLEEWLGHLSGQVRALEFALPVLEKEKARLTAQVVTSGEKYSVLREEYDRVNVELKTLRSTGLEEESVLMKLRETAKEPFPSDLEVEALREKLIPNSEKLATLKERLTRVSDTSERDALKASVSKLFEKLVFQLDQLEANQVEVCEQRMDLLTRALDREEELLVQARQHRYTGSSSMDQLDELERQQELMVSLHADLKSANEKRNALAQKKATISSNLQIK